MAYGYTMAVRRRRETCHAVPLAGNCELFPFLHLFLHKGNKNPIDCYCYKYLIEVVENGFTKNGIVVYVLNKTTKGLLDGNKTHQ